jgi:pilus assembly protein CpaE
MRGRPRILLASRSTEAIHALQHVLAGQGDLEVVPHVIDGTRADPLAGLIEQPDLLLLRLDGHSTPELDALADYTAAERPALIVIGDGSDAHAMRAAMRLGARDYLPEPVVPDELLASVARVATEQAHTTTRREQGQIIGFINAKGGSGATFLACNVAYMLSGVSDLKTVLVDLDLQFGALPQYLDIQPKRSLLEALDVADELDDMAIQAYLTRHETGLAIFGGLADHAILQQQDLLTGRFETLLDLLCRNFDRVVVDLPRQIEPFGALTLERADRIMLILQQSVPSLHDAARMYEILTRTLAIPADRISVVVNRYHKNLSVELEDIQETLQLDLAPICIPNDFRAATESINMGVPVYQQARRSPVTKALTQLEAVISGKNVEAPRGGLLPRLLRTG